MRSHAVPQATIPDAQRPEVPNLLASLWQKYLPLMRERLATLDGAAAAARQGVFDTEQRALAVDAAHKFAGSLGMFGYAEGTDAARSIEHLLLQSETLDPVRFLGLVSTLHAVLNL